GSTSQAIGTAWTVANPFIWIENNLLVNIDMPSEGEVFSIKSPGNIIRGNTLINVMMYISLRTTHDTEVSRNWIEGGTNLAINGHGRNNRYIANRILDGGELRIGAGDATTQDQIDALPTSTVFYAASENCQVVDNIVEEDGQIRVGGFWSTWGSLPNHEPARNNNLWGNVSLEGGDAHVLVSGGPTRHTGTTFLDPGIDYDPAVKLTTADVGIEADDPICSASNGGGGGTPGTLTDRIG